MFEKHQGSCRGREHGVPPTPLKQQQQQQQQTRYSSSSAANLESYEEHSHISVKVCLFSPFTLRRYFLRRHPSKKIWFKTWFLKQGAQNFPDFKLLKPNHAASETARIPPRAPPMTTPRETLFEPVLVWLVGSCPPTVHDDAPATSRLIANQMTIQSSRAMQQWIDSHLHLNLPFN